MDSYLKWLDNGTNKHNNRTTTIELRNKKKHSKQIVSYTLEEDSQKEYGYPDKGNTTLYDRDIYVKLLKLYQTN